MISETESNWVNHLCIEYLAVIEAEGGEAPRYKMARELRCPASVLKEVEKTLYFRGFIDSMGGEASYKLWHLVDNTALEAWVETALTEAYGEG